MPQTYLFNILLRPYAVEMDKLYSERQLSETLSPVYLIESFLLYF